jgi:hypothetical protein
MQGRSSVDNLEVQLLASDLDTLIKNDPMVSLKASNIALQRMVRERNAKIEEQAAEIKKLLGGLEDNKNGARAPEELEVIAKGR